MLPDAVSNKIIQDNATLVFTSWLFLLCCVHKKSNNAFPFHRFLGFIDAKKLEEEEDEAVKEAEVEKLEEVKAEDEEISKPVTEGKLYRH